MSWGHRRSSPTPTARAVRMGAISAPKIPLARKKGTIDTSRPLKDAACQGEKGKGRRDNIVCLSFSNCAP